jgi:hypothetical protein
MRLATESTSGSSSEPFSSSWFFFVSRVNVPVGQGYHGSHEQSEYASPEKGKTRLGGMDVGGVEWMRRCDRAH